jgi:hypothetical protein
VAAGHIDNVVFNSVQDVLTEKVLTVANDPVTNEFYRFFAHAESIDVHALIANDFEDVKTAVCVDQKALTELTQMTSRLALTYKHQLALGTDRRVSVTISDALEFASTRQVTLTVPFLVQAIKSMRDSFLKLHHVIHTLATIETDEDCNVSKLIGQLISDCGIKKSLADDILDTRRLFWDLVVLTHDHYPHGSIAYSESLRNQSLHDSVALLNSEAMRVTTLLSRVPLDICETLLTLAVTASNELSALLSPMIEKLEKSKSKDGAKAFELCVGNPTAKTLAFCYVQWVQMRGNSAKLVAALGVAVDADEEDGPGGKLSAETAKSLAVVRTMVGNCALIVAMFCELENEKCPTKGRKPLIAKEIAKGVTPKADACVPESRIVALAHSVAEAATHPSSDHHGIIRL